MVGEGSNKKSFVTISVDDGAPGDLKTAELLENFNLKATFYIPARNSENKLLSKEEIKKIAEKFEIGGHTFNHVPLVNLSREAAKEEIESGKKWLEDCVGREVISFCYPRGKFSQQTVKLVKEAGFLGARTCMFNHVSWPKDSYLWGVSTQAYSHTIGVQLRHALLEGNFRGIGNYITKFKLNNDWDKHFNCALDYVQKNGGVAHLYFHSWEIDKLNQWKKLRNVLKNLSKGENFKFVTNGDLFRAWHAERNKL